jgi:hypothetical protein
MGVPMYIQSAAERGCNGELYEMSYIPIVLGHLTAREENLSIYPAWHFHTQKV